MKIGYARVSTRDQSLDLQIDALEGAGCKRVFQETASGAKASRPVMTQMLKEIRAGDILVIYKLDRLGRSLIHLVRLIEDLQRRDVALLSLNDPIDTTTAQGRLIFGIFAALAEFERDLISERTKAGLESARARGKKGGRPRGLSKEAKLTASAAAALYKEGRLTIAEICGSLGIAKGTLYRYLDHENVQRTRNYGSWETRHWG
jgi:DNA invertase Pin-like site-specific DNA recombinase